MQDQLNTVIRQLFHKDSLVDVPEQALREFTEKYPYSPIGQLLLAKKLRQSRTDGFAKQAVKSVLYFNNPLWFDWLISMEHFKDQNNDEAIKDTPSPIDPLIAEAIPEDETVQESTADENLQDSETISQTSNEDLVTENISIEKLGTESFDDELIENTGFVPDPPATQQTEENFEEDFSSDESFTEAEISNDQPKDQLQVQNQNTVVENEQVSHKHRSTDEYDDELIDNTGFFPVEQTTTEESSTVEIGSSESVPFKTGPEFQRRNNGHPDEQRTETKINESESFDDEIIENSGFTSEGQSQSDTTAPLPSDLIEKGPQVEEKATSKDELAFEPYHTIDYFASQGIKLKQEDLEKDKFGKQLKSFTEWLRSMKKIPGSKSPQNLEVEQGESATIRKKADESIEGKEVETETMAEVWAKQGNISKAISIYEKLSLSNPDKTHYFAAKIEQLKAN